MTNTKYDYHFTGAGDTGNSKFKGFFTVDGGQDVYIEEKSLTSKLTAMPMFPDQSIEKAVVNLLDNMIVEINSKAIKFGGLFAVGEKASHIGRTRNMNISTGSKHTDDLPIMTTLSIIATNAVQHDFSLTKKLARELFVSVDYSTAIPAREYTKKAANSLEDKFLNGEHIVVVHVAEDEYVSVKIKFNRVKVTQEGNPAAFAIVYGEDALMNDFIIDYPNDAAVNADFESKKILHVDIGDGTTEFVYTIAGKPIADLSTGERYGVGHAAKQALRAFKDDIKVNLNMTRQDFMDAVIDDTHIQHEEAKAAMLDASIDQSQAIVEKVEEMYIDSLKGDVEIVSVFGGGSAQFKHVLKEMMMEAAERMNFKVLWIPDKFSAQINALGLKELNNRVFFK